MTAGGGTLSLGIETTNGDTNTTEGEAYSVAYSTTSGSAVAVVTLDLMLTATLHLRLT